MLEDERLKKIVSYIIKFLLNGDEELASQVCYSWEYDKHPDCRIFIKPSSFFSKEKYLKPDSLPRLPLKLLDGIEILYGEPNVKHRDGKVFIEADIVASSFFLLSRYEELVATKDSFDCHSRFSAQASLPYRAEFLFRPIVDEYGMLLRKWLESSGLSIPKREEGFSQIYLTHDIDSIGYYQHCRGFMSGVYHSFFNKNTSIKKVISSLIDEKKDPAYTFPWLIEQAKNIKYAEQLFFIKPILKSSHIEDKPFYDIRSKKFCRLLDSITTAGGSIGLHSSYASYYEPHLVEQEAYFLRKYTQTPISSNRCHYLTILPPNNPLPYIKAGIKDDFSLTYASQAGFRLGTCRPVLWIDPDRLQIIPIVLHPTTIMDCTLSNDGYMKLSIEEAYSHTKNILSEIHKHCGEAIMLWHNTSIAPQAQSYHKELYTKVLREVL